MKERNFRMHPSLLLWIFPLIFGVRLVVGEDAVSVFPKVLDSLAQQNLPVSFKLKVKEIHTSSVGLEKESLFYLYVADRGRRVGIAYEKSPLNPKKTVFSNNYGMDIWTLDSAGGRLRKIAFHKMKEPVNGTDFSYWDIFPLILLGREDTLKSDTGEEGGKRLLRLYPGDRSAYGEIQLFMEKQDMYLDRIGCFTHSGKLYKEMLMRKSAKKKRKFFRFRSILLKDLKKGTQTEHQFLKIERLKKFPEKISGLPVMLP
ncbi:outer membrane lipoprotein-sorting protein [Fibrobacterota bacterium]